MSEDSNIVTHKRQHGKFYHNNRLIVTYLECFYITFVFQKCKLMSISDNEIVGVWKLVRAISTKSGLFITKSRLITA